MALSKEQKVVGIAILEDDSVKVSTKVTVKDGDDVVAEKNDYYVLSKLDSEGEATDDKINSNNFIQQQLAVSRDGFVRLMEESIAKSEAEPEAEIVEAA